MAVAVHVPSVSMSELPAQIEAYEQRAAAAQLQIAELVQRIAAGKRKLEEVKVAGRETLPVLQKIGELEWEKRQLEQHEQVPLYVLRVIQETAMLWVKQLYVGQGGYLEVSIEGFSLRVQLDEPPF